MRKNKNQNKLTNKGNFGINHIQMNKFLFKKIVPISKPSQYLSSAQHKYANQSLHIRLRSQVSKHSNQKSSLNLKTIIDQKPKKAASLDLTSRVLKWYNLKNKIQANQDKNKYAFQKKSILSQEDNLNKRNFTQIKYGRKLPKYQTTRVKSFHKSPTEVLNIADNYKQTKRIVFVEQMQQKKQKQKSIYNHQLRKNNINLVQKPYFQEKNFGQKARRSIMCRPWSGDSLLSNH